MKNLLEGKVPTKDRHLVVAETFYSIQGEGPTSGVPAVFLRLAGCNLMCEGPGWRCDSVEVWRKGVKTEYQNILNSEYIKHLDRGAHLIITGGEPLLHQYAILGYLRWFVMKYGWLPVIEVETNGTIVPFQKLVDVVSHWNVSFKLSSVGEHYAKRVNEVALKTFNSLDRATFKIVISSREDVLELINDFQHLNQKKIMVMPAGENQELLNSTREIVIDAAKTFMWRYCDRLHIVAWNKKTGV